MFFLVSVVDVFCSEYWKVVVLSARWFLSSVLDGVAGLLDPDVGLAGGSKETGEGAGGRAPGGGGEGPGGGPGEEGWRRREVELVLEKVLPGLPGGCEGRADCRGDPWLEVPHHRAHDSALPGVAEAGGGLRDKALGGDEGPGRGDRPGGREGPRCGVEGGCAGGPARGPAGAHGRVDSGGDPGLEGTDDLGNQVRLGRSGASGGYHPGGGDGGIVHTSLGAGPGTGDVPGERYH